MKKLIGVVAAATLIAGGFAVAALPAQARVGERCSGTKLASLKLTDGTYYGHLGNVELWYKNGYNCVQTVKTKHWQGAPDYVAAALAVGTTGNPRTAKVAKSDRDYSYEYKLYAGGVWLSAANRCVKFAGVIGLDRSGEPGFERYDSYASGWGHCR